MEVFKIDEKRVASQLKGNTMRVYWYLLQSSKGFVGPRDVQRKLLFSSPALAVYHLEKLVELGLVKKVRGEYHLTKIISAGILKQFIKLGAFMIPRFVLYATMFTTLFIFYILQVGEITFHSIFAIIFGFLGTAILWYETIRIRQSKP